MWLLKYITTLLFLSCCQQCIASKLKVAPEYQKIYKLLKDITSGYRLTVRPNFFKNATSVGIELYLLGIPTVDDEKMELSLDMYFRQYWNDDRLKFPDFSIIQNKQLPNTINQIKHSSLKRILWTPDPFFVNQKEGKVLDNPADNTLFKLINTGDITYSSRQLITTYCPMDFHAYPFDTQKCSLEIESFGHTFDEIRFFWKGGNSSVELSSFIVPSFKVLGHQLAETFVELKTGRYNRLKCHFYLKRKIDKFVHNSVVPSTIIVMTSSLAFWLHALDQCGSRVLILVISVLSLLGIYIKNTHFLIVGYLTYADYYFFCCFAFLAFNISLFLLVLIVRRNDRRTEQNGREQGYCLKRVTWLDGIARFLYVPVFVAFVALFINQSEIVVPNKNLEQMNAFIPNKHIN